MNDVDNLQFDPRPFRRPWLPVVVATLALLIHSPSWSHPFVYDDVTAVRDHPLVRGDGDSGGWFEVLRSPYWPADVSPDPLYRPLTIATLRLDYALFGGAATGFHVVNSVLHACVSVLVALLAQRLWDSRGAGWFAGLLFAAHPACTEAVVPIVGRSELLALFFIVWMVFVHLGPAGARPRPSVQHHLKLTLLYALACASKEHGLLAIVVIAAVDWRNRPRFGVPNVDYRAWARTLVSSHYLGMILVLCAFFTMRWFLFGTHATLPLSMVDTLLHPLAGADATTRLATAFALCALAFGLIFCVRELCPIWGVGGFDLPTSFVRLDVLIGMAIVAAFLVAVWIALRNRTPAGRISIPLVGLVAFMVLPCHFVPGAHWLFAERWLYAPIAMLLLASSGISRIAPRRTMVGVLVVVPLMSMMGVRYQRCWRSDEALMRAAVERQPRNAVALSGLCAIRDRGGDIESASVFVARLVRYHPDAARTWYYKTRLLIAQDRYEEASDALKRFVTLAGVRATLRDASGMRRRIERGLRRRRP